MSGDTFLNLWMWPSPYEHVDWIEIVDSFENPVTLDAIKVTVAKLVKGINYWWMDLVKSTVYRVTEMTVVRLKNLYMCMKHIHVQLLESVNSYVAHSLTSRFYQSVLSQFNTLNNFQ